MIAALLVSRPLILPSLAQGWMSRFKGDAKGNPTALDKVLYSQNNSDPVLKHMHRYTHVLSACLLCICSSMRVRPPVPLSGRRPLLPPTCFSPLPVHFWGMVGR